MNVETDNGRKIRLLLVRDYCGNPVVLRVGNELPRLRFEADQSVEVTDMYIEASYHGDHDLFFAVLQLGNGNRLLLNVKNIELVELI